MTQVSRRPGVSAIVSVASRRVPPVSARRRSSVSNGCGAWYSTPEHQTTSCGPTSAIVAGSCRSPCTKRTDDERRACSALKRSVVPITSTPVTDAAPASSAAKQSAPWMLHMQPTSTNERPATCCAMSVSRGGVAEPTRARTRATALRDRPSMV